MLRKVHKTIVICLIFATTQPAAAQSANSRLFKNTDVFDLEVATDPQVAPHARSIAYVRKSNDIMTDKARSNIWVISATGGDHRPLLSGRGDYSSPRWSPTGDRIAFVSGAEGGKPQLYVRWMDTGQTALLTNLVEAPDAIAWAPDGRSIAFTMFVEDKVEPLAKPPKKPEGAEWAEPVKMIEDIGYRSDGAGYLRSGQDHIFLVPADGGTPRQITSGAYDHGGPLSWAPNGGAILFAANRNKDWELDPVEADIFSINITDRKITKLTDRDGPDFSPRVSPDGQRIAYLGFDDKRMGHHTTRLYVMNAAGGERTVLSGNLDRSIDAVEWDGDNKLIAQYDDHGRTYLVRFSLDGTTEPLVRDVGGTSLGRPYTSGGFSTAKGVVAYTSDRAARPADIAVLPADGRATRLTRLNDDILRDKTLGDVERMTWKSSSGGREIEGWLVKPPNFDPAKKYPLILEIHGGPFAAYGPHFSAEIQLYAAAGYAVLYANPRGSTSYGDAFANLIHHAYPGRDYDDLMSGVDAVIAKGFIDTSKLFATGGSGGGVLSAWIVGKTNRFRAAVVAKPVINWISFALTADAYPFFYRYWFEKAPWEDPMAYWRRSPLSLVGNVSTPTMLLTGEADYRTPISESEQFYQALKLRGVETAMIRVPDSPHLIAGRPSNLIAKVDNIIAWFERHSAAPAKSATAAADQE